ncbi:hypothetical protein Msi02_52900 [Microbispora siamensis]|uniref:Uncharacterized protein n=1 Tax=Microbispora siamensis TaxID=564413 RepID=A0ABQ4GSV5_9ACTN|nr:hypothetical protein Msi02_52900 [Microbispora siamensis]
MPGTAAAEADGNSGERRNHDHGRQERTGAALQALAAAFGSAHRARTRWDSVAPTACAQQ